MQWLETLVQFASESLGEEQREALWGRGVTDEQISDFRIGYVDRKLPPLAGADGFLEWSERGNRLRDMFVFPLTNTLGQVKGLQFRHVDRGMKGYRDYMPYEDEPLTFGLGQAVPHIWETGTVILVEGTYDMFPVQRVMPNVIPMLTAGVSETWVRLFRRFVEEVWVAFDADNAGRRGAQSFQREHGRTFRTNIIDFPQIPMPDGQGKTKDPSDLWEAWGDAQFGVFLKRKFDPYMQEMG